MNIGEIAQILTGVATLFVAIVLVLQLRKQNQQLEIQNKENQREIINFFETSRKNQDKSRQIKEVFFDFS